MFRPSSGVLESGASVERYVLEHRPVELIELPFLGDVEAPLELEMLLLVVVHEAGRVGGVGAEIGAEVQKKCFLKLSAPVKLITGWE